jgi:hypothetical protein
MPTSRDIPQPIQREVRQRCGFGCVFCGLPLYEYDHVVDWSTVRKHVAEDITLLCDTHHREKTNGLLPVEDIREANRNPYNLRVGVSKPYDLHYEGEECMATIGSSYFTTRDRGYGTNMIPLMIDSVPVLGFVLADGHLLLNLFVCDEYNNPVLQIVNNQLVYTVSSWDIQLTGRNLIIREAHRKILIDIVFEVPNKVVINRGRFLLNGVEVFIRPEQVLINNNRMFNNNRILLSEFSADDYPVGLLLGPNLLGLRAAFALGNIPRYLGDRSEARKWARQILEEGAQEADNT